MNPDKKITCPYCGNDRHQPTQNNRGVQCLNCLKIFHPSEVAERFTHSKQNPQGHIIQRCPLCGGEIKDLQCQKCSRVFQRENISQTIAPV